ncbi:MAG: hypothetical protein ABI863_03620 [Ginsengibacter sp.]
MKQNLIIIAVSFLLLSCQKEFTNDTPTIGGNVGNTKPADTCESYFPLTTGSTWTYDLTGDTQVNTVTTPDTVIGGNTFKRITQDISGDVSNSFYREENGNIYAFLDLSRVSNVRSNVLINPLRSRASVGDKWHDTIVINNITERLEYEIVEKNISHQVDTLHFNNVLHVQYSVRLDRSPIITDQLVQITDVWYAKCVGVVETENQLLLSSTLIGSPNKLKNYSIH